MKTNSIPYDYYEAVAINNVVLCVSCCPPYQLEESLPILAGSEWYYSPTCDVCGKVHNYVLLTDEGW